MLTTPVFPLAPRPLSPALPISYLIENCSMSVCFHKKLSNFQLFVLSPQSAAGALAFLGGSCAPRGARYGGPFFLKSCTTRKSHLFPLLPFQLLMLTSLSFSAGCYWSPCLPWRPLHSPRRPLRPRLLWSPRGLPVRAPRRGSRASTWPQHMARLLPTRPRTVRGVSEGKLLVERMLCEQ